MNKLALGFGGIALILGAVWGSAIAFRFIEYPGFKVATVITVGIAILLGVAMVGVASSDDEEGDEGEEQ